MLAYIIASFTVVQSTKTILVSDLFISIQIYLYFFLHAYLEFKIFCEFKHAKRNKETKKAFCNKLCASRESNMKENLQEPISFLFKVWASHSIYV